jgi:hypothetical protein
MAFLVVGCYTGDFIFASFVLANREQLTANGLATKDYQLKAHLNICLDPPPEPDSL